MLLRRNFTKVRKLGFIKHVWLGYYISDTLTVFWQYEIRKSAKEGTNQTYSINIPNTTDGELVAMVRFDHVFFETKSSLQSTCTGTNREKITLKLRCVWSCLTLFHIPWVEHYIHLYLIYIWIFKSLCNVITWSPEPRFYHFVQLV